MRRAAIFTAKSTETVAVRAQLVGPIGSRKAGNAVYDVWHLKVQGEGGAVVPDLEVALYETKRGQEAVMRAVPQIVTEFNADVVLYLGCAGGMASKLRIGDVFVVTDVWPYELGKETDQGFVSRAHPLPPDNLMIDYAKLESERQAWRKRIPSEFAGAPEVKFGALASGSKVLATEEGASWKLTTRLTDEAYAVDTEGYAFYKSMNDVRRHYLMIRGISDNLVNKNTSGADADDRRQTQATANAAAFATQLLIEIDYGQLRTARGIPAPGVNEHKRIGRFWSSEWTYGPENCKDLLRIELDRATGLLSGERVSITGQYGQRYRIRGQIYDDNLHLLAVPEPSSRAIIVVSLFLKTSDRFGDFMEGFAIRPQGRKRPPSTDNIIVHERLSYWAAPVTYKHIADPSVECSDLWKLYNGDGGGLRISTGA